jgi:hypothetical protein
MAHEGSCVMAGDSPRVMAGEGRLPTTLLRDTKESRGWPASAGHDTGGVAGHDT